MSEPSVCETSALIIALMYPDKKIYDKIKDILEKEYGKCDESEEFEFRFTEFYEKEFGESLKKRYLVFTRPFDMENLPEAKHLCYRLEKEHSKEGKRRINIDPGYMSMTKIVLSSFKPRPHRILLRDSVYADLQLVYEKREWTSLSWTFPDMMMASGFFKEKREYIKDFKDSS